MYQSTNAIHTQRFSRFAFYTFTNLLSLSTKTSKYLPTDRGNSSIHTIQIKRGTDQSQVAKCLWSIPELFTGSGNLLGEHHEVIREREHVLEDVDGSDVVFAIVDPGARERFHEPECTHAKCAFTAADACGGVMSEGSREGGGRGRETCRRVIAWCCSDIPDRLRSGLLSPEREVYDR
jgi:hypothetical protein